MKTLNDAKQTFLKLSIKNHYQWLLCLFFACLAKPTTAFFAQFLLGPGPVYPVHTRSPVQKSIPVHPFDFERVWTGLILYVWTVRCGLFFCLLACYLSHSWGVMMLYRNKFALQSATARVKYVVSHGHSNTWQILSVSSTTTYSLTANGRTLSDASAPCPNHFPLTPTAFVVLFAHTVLDYSVGSKYYYWVCYRYLLALPVYLAHRNTYVMFWSEYSWSVLPSMMARRWLYTGTTQQGLISSSMMYDLPQVLPTVVSKYYSIDIPNVPDTMSLPHI